MGYFSLTNIAVTLTTLVVVRRIYWELTIGSRQRSFSKQHGCLPPKQKKWKDPLFSLDAMIGNYQALKEHRLIDFWCSWLSENNAHTIWTKLMGTKIFLTDDPENIKTILATSFHDYSVGHERIKALSAVIGQGIFTSDGPVWKHSRDMLRPCFERHHVADTSVLDKHTTRLIDLLPADGSTVDLHPFFQQLAFDIVTEFLLGKSVNSLSTMDEQDSACREFVESFDYVTDPMSEKNKNKKWGMLRLYLPDSESKKCVKRMQHFVDTIVAEELSSQAATSTSTTEPSNSPPKSANRHLFLPSLLSESSDDLVRVRSELLNMLVAGRDTTSAVLTNSLFELPRHPAIYARLRAEIHTHASSPPTYDELKKMKYLRAFVNESLRLHSILPSNSRQALKDTTLPRGGGPDGTAPVFVPKGVYVAFQSHSLHRRRDIWGEDADEFVPERWLDHENPTHNENDHNNNSGKGDGNAGTATGTGIRPGWAYVPFNGGPRVCIGQNFALTQVMFVLARLMQVFDIESRDDGPWTEKMALTCVNFGGAKVGLRKRTAAVDVDAA